MPRDTTTTFGILPWRGPEVPVNEDDFENKRSRLGLYVQVAQLDMAKDEDRQLYASVLNRTDAGYAQVLAERVSEYDGGFRMLLVWGERYQCGSGFVPDEGRPVVRNNALGNVVHPDDTSAPVKEPVFGDPRPIQSSAPTAVPEPDPARPTIRMRSRDSVAVDGVDQ